MSYELYFKPRQGAAERSKILEYFASRPNYTVNPPQAWYQNEDTGVYFVFEWQDDDAEVDAIDAYPVSLNINFFRPSYFIQEAEPEVTAFVRAFDLVVLDPQTNGMGEGEYDPERLKSGWNDGNDYGHAAILQDPKNREGVASLPTAVLFDAWTWNHQRRRLQDDLRDSRFVPKVLFIRLDGEVRTAAVWPDGIPIAVPNVEVLVVPRKRLAPRRLFKRVEDRTLVALKDALPVLEKFGTRGPGDLLVLDYETPPNEMDAFITSLPQDRREIEGLAVDQVLDRELVAKHLE